MPGEHLVQSFFALIPFPVWYVPAGAAKHDLNEMLPIRLLYVPAGHGMQPTPFLAGW